jgi:hypothetical protein
MAGGILWLASYPKSGNTWVRIFIENLFRNAHAPASINDLKVVGFGDAHIPTYERLAMRRIGEMTDRELHALRESVQRDLANRDETSIVKTHNILDVHEGRPLIYPQYTMGGIYIVRNVFDVTVSIARHYNISVSDAVEAICAPGFRTPTTAAAVFQVLGRWCDHYRSWTALPQLSPLVLRYEDLRSKPFKTFGKVVKFLKLPADAERIKRAIRFSNFDEVSSQERAAGFKERVREDQVFFHSGRVGGWRDHLTDDLVGRLVDVHGEVLRELGYLDKQGRPTV